MRELLAIAFRNLARQKRRTALTGAALVIGVAVTVFMTGFFNGMMDLMVRLTVESAIGALQIHKKGHLDSDEPIKVDMPDDDAFNAKVKAVANVAEVSPRIQFEGMLNNGSQASVVLGTAVDPRVEKRVCPGRDGIEQLTARDGEDVLLGAELAKSLRLEKGSAPTILVSTQAGQSNALDANVAGTIGINMPLAAKTIALVPLAYAQRLLRMPNRVTEYAVSVHDLSTLAEARTALSAAIGGDYEVHTWREREPAAAAGIDRFSIVVVIVVTVLFMLVGSIIVNSMLMSVQERTREIGTMLSLGVRRRQILAIILAEGSFLALFASFIGVAVGGAIVMLLHARGVTFALKGAPPLHVYPFTTAALIGRIVMGAVLGTILASAYPAYRASRLTPVEALRTV